MKGDSSYINHLDGSTGAVIFDNNGTSTNKLLTYGITTKATDGGWMKTTTDKYTYYVSGTPNVFDYNASNGTFDCTSGTYCDKLTK
jgi:hypothetical protein